MLPVSTRQTWHSHLCLSKTGLSDLGDATMRWHCWLGIRKGIWPIKIEWWGVGMYLRRARYKWVAGGLADAQKAGEICGFGANLALCRLWDCKNLPDPLPWNLLLFLIHISFLLQNYPVYWCWSVVVILGWYLQYHASLLVRVLSLILPISCHLGHKSWRLE